MSDRPPIRIVVADDHEIVRKGLVALLSTEEGMEVVGEASDGEGAVAQVLALAPDVVLMDLVMPRMDGIAAMRALRRAGCTAAVVVLTSFGSDNKVFPAIRAGAVAYLLKDASPDELCAAIVNAANGKSSLDADVARRVLRELQDAPAEPLTDRELEILREIARGIGNERIGERLFISVATVRSHVSHILSKLGLSNRTEAALYALRVGITSLDEIDADP